MIDKINTLFWFVSRPKYIPQIFQILKRKQNTSLENSREQSEKWCKENVVSQNKALKTLIANASLKHKKLAHTQKHPDMYTFSYFLAMEIHDAYKNQGASCQAKNVLHKQAEHNRNYIRKRWW